MSTLLAYSGASYSPPASATAHQPFELLRQRSVSAALAMIGMRPIDHYFSPPPSLPLNPSLPINDAGKRQDMLLAFVASGSMKAGSISDEDRANLAFLLHGGYVRPGALAHLRGHAAIERIIAALAAEESIEGIEALTAFLQ